MEPTVEQRKHRRHPVNLQGVYSSGSVQVRDAVVLDLSMEGCRVASTIPIPPDTTIQLQIRPHQAASIYVSSAIVRWARGYAFGAQFQELPEHESIALTHLLGSLPPRGRTVHRILSARPDALPKAIEECRQSAATPTCMRWAARHYGQERNVNARYGSLV